MGGMAERGWFAAFYEDLLTNVSRACSGLQADEPAAASHPAEESEGDAERCRGEPAGSASPRALAVQVTCEVSRCELDRQGGGGAAEAAVSGASAECERPPDRFASSLAAVLRIAPGGDDFLCLPTST